jgi:uroporphyrinogen decarboxylase
VPYTGVHVGSLIGQPADRLLHSADLLVAGLLEAHRLYSPDGQPVVFDLQIEAEVLGCELVWAEKAPPSVSAHPFATTKGVPGRLPERNKGRIGLVLEAMRRMKEKVGATTALYGLFTGPLTLASHLRGTELFLDMYDDPDYVDELLSFCTNVGLRMAALYIEAGMDVIASVDPMTSQISPETFERFVATPFGRQFAAIRAARRASSLFVCGDATRNLAAMAATGPDCLSVDENIDMVEAKKVTDRAGITLSGNIPLATVMLLGTQADSQKYALDLISKMGRRDFILAPGCDMPYDVPAANLVGVTQAVHDERATAAYLEHYVRSDVAVDVEMPDYAHMSGALVEVFTIDSATCAACGYMKAAADAAAAEVGSAAQVIERKTATPQNIARAQRLGLAHLPALVVNGKLVFSSVIPGRRALVEAIAAAVRAAGAGQAAG